MLRLKGKVLNLEPREGVNKDGKPYYGNNVLVVDQDNEVCLVRVFDRDGTLKTFVKGVKLGSEYEFAVDKCERLANRTFDCIGQFVK